MACYSHFKRMALQKKKMVLYFVPCLWRLSQESGHSTYPLNDQRHFEDSRQG